MAQMRFKKLTRRHVCSVAGCRNRETFMISRRDDVGGYPLYLCPKCIRESEARLRDYERAQKELEAKVVEASVEKVEERTETKKSTSKKKVTADE